MWETEIHPGQLAGPLQGTYTPWTHTFTPRGSFDFWVSRWPNVSSDEFCNIFPITNFNVVFFSLSLFPVFSQAASKVPIQCLDDVEKNNNHTVPRVSVPRPPSAPPLPSCSGRPCPPAGGHSGTLLPDSLRDDCWYNGPWPSQRCSGEALATSNTCSVFLPPPPQNQASLDDSSRSFPSPPKPSDTMFWEGHSATSSSSSVGNCTPRSPPNTEWAKPFWKDLQWLKRVIG